MLNATQRFRGALKYPPARGVSATPTFFINGLRHDGGLQALGAALAAALPKAPFQKETSR